MTQGSVPKILRRGVRPHDRSSMAMRRCARGCPQKAVHRRQKSAHRGSSPIDQKLPGVALNDPSHIKTRVGASQTGRNGPVRSRIRSLTWKRQSAEKTRLEVGKDPKTQRMEKLDLAEFASFAARSDEPFLPTAIRELAEKRGPGNTGWANETARPTTRGR